MGNRIEFLREAIAQAVAEIDAIQTTCSHPKQCLIKTHRSNTGNYDPSSDCYWTDYHCDLCDKKWTLDGSH